MKTKHKSNTNDGNSVKPFLRRSKTVFSNKKIWVPVVIGVLVIVSTVVIFSCRDGKGDDVVAKVGSRQITLKNVDSIVKQQLDQNGTTASAISSSELAAARLRVLSDLINNEALFQKAQKEGQVPDDTKVNQEIQKRKTDSRLTEDQFQRQLQQAGLKEEDLRDSVKKELAISQLQDREKARITNPTDEEIRRYYDDRKASFILQPGVDLSVIVTDPANNGLNDDSISDAAAEAKIKEIYEQLKGGADFTTIAAQRSEDPTAEQAGSLGFIPAESLPNVFPTRPELPQRLMSMNPGQYTEPIKNNVTGKWMIVKLNNKRNQAQNLTFENVRQNIFDTLKEQKQAILLNALSMIAITEVSVRNYLAEREVERPGSLAQLQPSQLLTIVSTPMVQPAPRIENMNQNQAGAENSKAQAPANTNAKRAASQNANKK